jgi:hypothetical protein
MKTIRLYFATLIGPLITGIIFILIDGLKSASYLDYIIKEAKQTYIFICVGLLVSIIAVKFFGNKITSNKSVIYFYWVKLYLVILFVLCVLEVFLREFHYGFDAKNAIMLLGFVMGLAFLPYCIIGLMLGVIYTPIILFFIRKK